MVSPGLLIHVAALWVLFERVVASCPHQFELMGWRVYAAFVAERCEEEFLRQSQASFGGIELNLNGGRVFCYGPSLQIRKPAKAAIEETPIDSGQDASEERIWGRGGQVVDLPAQIERESVRTWRKHRPDEGVESA